MSGSEIATELAASDLPELETGWGLPLARGVYYRPSGRRPHVAFIAAHYELDFSHHYLAPLLAGRGFGFLGWNTRYCGQGGRFVLDRALDDIEGGVRWLRERGVEAVALLGNSGGGSLLAAYQAERSGRGELYVSLAAHPGRAEVLTNWLDPSVRDEQDPASTDPALDMYNPDNGPPYPPEFVARYRSAQRARNQRITDWCKRELARLERAGYRDRVFSVQRTWADLRFADPDLDPSERPTPACYRGDPERANRGGEGLADWCSLRGWLSMWSLEDARPRAAEHLRRIKTPALVVQASADTGVFPSDAKAICDALGSEDRRLVSVPGDHYFRKPSTARDAVAELIEQWVNERL